MYIFWVYIYCSVLYRVIPYKYKYIYKPACARGCGENRWRESYVSWGGGVRERKKVLRDWVGARRFAMGALMERAKCRNESTSFGKHLPP